MSLTTDQTKWVTRSLSVTLGCDPELFLAGANGKVIGAEKVIPKEGLASTSALTQWPYPRGSDKGLVLDGVQLELHPPPATCRQTLAASLGQIFIVLAKELEGKDIKASFEPVVRVPKKEMDTLSEAAKTLGCTPSLNAHKASATVKLSKKDALMRSAAGHIHLGSAHIAVKHGQKDLMIKLANTLDVLVGLPCVLLDRDPNAAKRRKVYGRAGEYRLPSHGFEYRTPSNFWLRNYYLMSFIMAQARTAVSIWYTQTGFQPSRVAHDRAMGGYYTKNLTLNHFEDLMKRVDMKAVVRAINKNDLDLASKEWAKVEPFIEEYWPSDCNGVHSGTTKYFRHFAERIESKGLAYWFPDDPMTHWCGNGSNKPGFAGFESFLLNTVGGEYNTILYAKEKAERKAA
jgi:hypothetical protein